MRNIKVAWIALILAAVVVAGGVFASNMGFKLNYPLTGPVTGTSENGTNTIGLPLNMQTGLADAFDLIQDIELSGGPGSVTNVQTYVKSAGGLALYDGATGAPFPLVSGEHYRVQVASDISYIIVGSHDPSMGITLTGPVLGTSENGTNTYAYPYHSVSVLADQLLAEIDAAAGSPVAVNIQRYVKSAGGLDLYDGATGAAFPLVPGEGYRIQVSADVTFIPAHY